MKKVRTSDRNISFMLTQLRFAHGLLQKGGYKEAELLEWINDYVVEKYAKERTCLFCGAKIPAGDKACPNCKNRTESGRENPDEGDNGVVIEKGSVVGENGVADFIDYLDRFKGGGDENEVTAIRIMSTTGDKDEVQKLCGQEKVFIKDTMGTRLMTLQAIAEEEFSDRKGHELWLQKRREQVQKERLARISYGPEPAPVEEIRVKDEDLPSRCCAKCANGHVALKLQDCVLCKLNLSTHKRSDSCYQFKME